jgi:hypothetical protein
MSVFTRRHQIRFHSNKDSQQSRLFKQTKTLRAARRLPFCAGAPLVIAGLDPASQAKGTDRPDRD